VHTPRVYACSDCLINCQRASTLNHCQYSIAPHCTVVHTGSRTGTSTRWTEGTSLSPTGASPAHLQQRELAKQQQQQPSARMLSAAWDSNATATTAANSSSASTINTSNTQQQQQQQQQQQRRLSTGSNASSSGALLSHTNSYSNTSSNGGSASFLGSSFALGMPPPEAPMEPADVLVRSVEQQCI
jgi:hypothetical protein